MPSARRSTRIDLISADTDLTPDCGKTSASRQTFVTGKAAELAAQALRAAILRAADAGDDARLQFGDGKVIVRDGGREQALNLAEMPADNSGYVLKAEETFNPPTSPLDENGQGVPYAVYGFGAHLAEIEVDMELGTVKVVESGRRPRCRPRHQPDLDRRADRRRRRPGARPRVDGRIHAGPWRESA